MFTRIKNFLQKHDVLYQNQYGFRENHSTEHAILDLVNQVQINMDQGKYTCGIFIDLRKAFDTVEHSILLHHIFKIASKQRKLIMIYQRKIYC